MYCIGYSGRLSDPVSPQPYLADCPPCHAAGGRWERDGRAAHQTLLPAAAPPP